MDNEIEQIEQDINHTLDRTFVDVRPGVHNYGNPERQEDPFGTYERCVRLRSRLLAEGHDIRLVPEGVLARLEWLGEVKTAKPVTSREKPYISNRPGFILISKAIRKYCDGSNVPGNMSRDHCRPDGGFDYQRHGQRCWVDEAQFAAYADAQRWTKAALESAQEFIETHKNSPAGQREALRKQHDVDWANLE